MISIVGSGYKNPRGVLRRGPSSIVHPPKLHISQLPPFTPTRPAAMSFNGTFDFTGFTGSDNNNLGRDNSNAVDGLLNTFDWGNSTSPGLYTHQYAGSSTNNDGLYLQPSNVTGPSQPYTWVEVLGNPNSFPDLNGPETAPTSLYPANRVSLDEASHVVHPKDHRSETHPPVAGHNILLYPDMAMPTFLPQPATIPPLPVYDPLSPIPTLSRGCK